MMLCILKNTIPQQRSLRQGRVSCSKDYCLD
jgi:hypothetical protein